jgi:putative peptide zinc metalloprotease protein
MTMTNTTDTPCPSLAPEVTLVGPMPDTGFEQEQWLVRRDGRFVQVSELLYKLLEQCDGRSGTEEIARALSGSSRWSVTPDNVTYLIEKKLTPLGLIYMPSGVADPAEPTEVERVEAVDAVESVEQGKGQQAGSAHRSALAINLRRSFLGPRAIDAVGGVLRFLFLPPVVVGVLTTAVVAQAWLFLRDGLSGSIAELLNRPAAFLVVVATVILAALFHEFGHAAGLRYGGGHPRRMGFGFYVIFPAFYTDVSDAYRLPRRARVRTDLGGPYFHLVFSLLVVGAFLLTGQEFLLIVVLLIDVEVLRQFVPFLRLDGYWLLADLAGVPDFFSQAGPFVRRAVPGRVSGPQLPSMRRSVKVTFAAFLLLTFVVLPALFVWGLLRLPHIGELAWFALLREGAALRQAWDGGMVLTSTALVVTMLLLMLQLAGLGAFVYLFAIRPILRAWAWTAGKPAPARSLLRSSLAMAVGGAAVVLGVFYPWRKIGPMGGGDIGGLSTHAGKLALACGVMLIAVAALVLLARGRHLRRAIAVGALSLGVAGAFLAAKDVVRTRGAVDQAIRQSIRQTTGHAIDEGQVRELRTLSAQLGITVSPGFGAYVSLGGGALAGGGAAILLAARPRKRATPDPDVAQDS